MKKELTIHPLAVALNGELQQQGSQVFSMLSNQGKRIFFPSKGILGQGAEASGKKINATLGTAFEEDGTPLVLEALEGMVSLSDKSFLYAPSFGNLDLRNRWKTMMVAKNPGLEGKNVSVPVVTSALTHGLSVCGYLFVDEGDEVIIPDLYWDNYELIFEEARCGQLKTYNTFKEGCFDIQAMTESLNQGEVGKRILLFNFPNNPAGYTVTQTEAVAICDALKKSAEAGNRIVALLDDAYFGLVYEDGVAKESLFSTLCDLHPNILAVKLDGPTKEDYVWSFRVGFLTFGFKGATAAQLKALEAKAAGVVRSSISNASGISQALLLKAYTHPDYDAQKQAKFDTLQKRYDKVREVLAAHPEFGDSFDAVPFNSGYFMCVKLKGVEPEPVRVRLLKDFDTGVIVLSGLIRIAFSAVPLQYIEQLFINLHQAVQAERAK